MKVIKATEDTDKRKEERLRHNYEFTWIHLPMPDNQDEYMNMNI